MMQDFHILNAAEKQEPVGYFKKEGDVWNQYYEDYPNPDELTALYTHPQPEAEKQEPNGYLWFTHHMEQRFTHYKPRQEQMIGEARPVYTHPQPKREWVGLTDEDIWQLRRDGANEVSDKHFKAIEAKLKEKNT